MILAFSGRLSDRSIDPKKPRFCGTKAFPNLSMQSSNHRLSVRSLGPSNWLMLVKGMSLLSFIRKLASLIRALASFPKKQLRQEKSCFLRPVHSTIISSEILARSLKSNARDFDLIWDIKKSAISSYSWRSICRLTIGMFRQIVSSARCSIQQTAQFGM